MTAKKVGIVIYGEGKNRSQPISYAPYFKEGSIGQFCSFLNIFGDFCSDVQDRAEWDKKYLKIVA